MRLLPDLAGVLAVVDSDAGDLDPAGVPVGVLTRSGCCPGGVSVE